MANIHRNGPVNGQHGGGDVVRLGLEKQPSTVFVDEETLVKLETLMNEFFHSGTSNERKRQIESILSEFSSLPQSWQMSFLYLKLSSNEYTKMFCLSVIETFINQRWFFVPDDLRSNFQSSLWKYLLEHHNQMTSAVRNKICKIMVLIARVDWPYNYPDYFNNILGLLVPDTKQNNGTNYSTLVLLGLNLLGTTVEELTSTSHNFSSNRKAELIELLESNLPAMLHSLTSMLELIISKHINFISATPPPSPTSSPPNSSFTSFNKANDTLNSVFRMSIKKGLLNTIPDMDSDFVQMTSQIFACLSRIIAFMPTSYYLNLNSTLLSALYVFATFGSINPSYHSAQLGLDSMSCINELMSKASTFNSESNEFIYNVFHNTFLILQRIISTSLKPPNDLSVSLEDKMDDEYIKKFIDFLRLFITGHLGRFETFISFPTKDFLNLLLEFTSKMHYSMEHYLMLLDTWKHYLEYLEQCLVVKYKDNATTSEKLQLIKEPIFELLLFVLRSIQYSCNREHLQQLDDCALDDDGKTELENFMETSIEIIAKIGEIYPEETITYLDTNYYNEKLQSIYYGLEFYVNNQSVGLSSTEYSSSSDISASSRSNANRKLFAPPMCQQPLGQLQLSVHDFITTLRMCSRFSNFFVDEFFERYLVRTKAIMDKLFEIVHFLEVHCCCDLHQPSPLSSEFFLLKAQLLATFKAYIVWFQQLCCSRNDATAQLGNGAQYLTVIFNTCCSIICENSTLERSSAFCDDMLAASQRKLLHSSSLTLNTFSSKVRPSFVFGLNSVQRLFDQTLLANLLRLGDVLNDSSQSNQAEAPVNKNTLNTSPITLTDQILISQSISNLLILPWFALQNDSQEWERRSHYLNLFVGYFVQLFNKLNLDSPPLNATGSATLSTIDSGVIGKITDESHKCPNVFCRSLYILKKVIRSHADSPVKSKQMLFMSLNSSLEAFIQLLVHNGALHSTVSGCQITERILALFIVVFDVLLAQVHIDFVKRTIQTLLQIIHTHDILSPSVNGQQSQSPLISQKMTSALKVIIKFIKLLSLIIKQTSVGHVSLRSLLPGIIDFVVLQIQTSLISGKSPANAYFGNLSGPHYDAFGKLLKIYYRFLYELLLNNGRYFFPINKISFGSANVVSEVPSNITTQSSVQTNQPQQHFENIMEIIGQSFMQPENIQLYRQNVEALESLNETIKLYSRPAFRATFLQRFSYLFVQTLLDRSLDLFEELLYTIVFHLVEVDFGQFYDTFIPKFLSNLQYLHDAQRDKLMANFNIGRVRSVNDQAEIDFPTFSSNLNRLLCDIRFYRKCNNVEPDNHW